MVPMSLRYNKILEWCARDRHREGEQTWNYLNAFRADVFAVSISIYSILSRTDC